jgi:hypothetical protein
MREPEHIAPVIDRVMDEAFKLHHAKPRALDAASRAREASYQVRRPNETQAPQRKRMPVGSVARGTACPHCDSAATKQGPRIECSWCGFVTVIDSVTYAIVGACTLANGKWPEHDGDPDAGGSST